MNWLAETLLVPSAIQAVIVICLICAVGLALGNIRFRGVSLGVTYVFLLVFLLELLACKSTAKCSVMQKVSA